MKIKERNSSIELFRIISMFLIVMHHYVVNSGIPSLYETGSANINQYVVQLLGAWGKTGINCFTLITGYFLIGKECPPKRAFKLWGEYFFWTILCFGFLALYDKSIISISDLIKGFFMPFLGAGYLAVVLYMFLLVPALNKLISNLTQKEYVGLLTVLLLYYTIVPSFTLNQHFDFLVWLCVIYLIGGYLKLYPLKILTKNKIVLPLLIISFIGLCCSIIFVSKYVNVAKSYWFISDANKIGALVISILFFSFFLNLKPTKSKIINTIAGTCWGVLCIHANSNAMRDFLWLNLFNNTYWFKTDYAILHCVFVSIVVFLVCSIMVIPFKAFFQNRWEKILDLLIVQPIKCVCRRVEKLF